MSRHTAPMRDLLMQLAVADLFRARWTADIHREWIDALLRRDPHRDRSALERTRDLMDRATRDSLIVGYDQLIPSLALPDADDRHVLAAAIVGRCDVIVTQNLKDFPAAVLEPYGIEARHPDDFPCEQFRLAPGPARPGPFRIAVRKVRARLKHPPYSVADYLDILTHQGLVATVAELESFAEAL